MQLPSSLTVGHQYFDASVGGLRRYLESVKATEPNLYLQLDPKLARLERRQIAAVALMVTGLVVPLATTVYALAGRKSCDLPSVHDPNFSAASDAWDKCHDDNNRFTGTVILVGLVTGIVAEIAAFATLPPRSALFDLVNEHNRLSPEPLRWQLGYNPSNRTAFGQLQLSF